MKSTKKISTVDMYGSDREANSREAIIRFNNSKNFLPELFHQSYNLRNKQVREYIFKGIGDGRLLSTRDAMTVWNYKGSPFFFTDDRGVEEYFAKLGLLINLIYRSVLNRRINLSEGKLYNVGVRFSALIYTLQLLLHPHNDGNKRTSILVSLSYFSELTGHANFDIRRLNIRMDGLRSHFANPDIEKNRFNLDEQLLQRLLPLHLAYLELVDSEYMGVYSNIIENSEVLLNFPLETLDEVVSNLTGSERDFEIVRVELDKVFPEDGFSELDIQIIAVSLRVKQVLTDYKIEKPIDALILWTQISEYQTLISNEIGLDYDEFYEFLFNLTPRKQMARLAMMLDWALDPKSFPDIMNYVFQNVVDVDSRMGGQNLIHITNEVCNSFQSEIEFVSHDAETSKSSTTE